MNLARKEVIEYVYNRYLNDESPELSEVNLWELYDDMLDDMLDDMRYNSVHSTFKAFKKDIALVFDIDKNDYLFKNHNTIRILKDRYRKLYNEIYHNPEHVLFVRANF